MIHLFSNKFRMLSLCLAVTSMAALHGVPVEAQEKKVAEVQEQGSGIKNLDPLYPEASYKNLSRLYWRMGRLDIENDQNVDLFLLINECDIYTDYFHNEFQWREIRQTARDKIIKNSKNGFSSRMKFVQPLKLGDYDPVKGGFKVIENFKVDGIRRFEIKSIDYKKDICTYQSNARLPGYPKGVLAELSRPIDLKYMPMDPVVAKEYIRLKTIELDNMSTRPKKRQVIADSRQVYIVMFVRFFSSVGDHYTSKERQPFAKLLGVLEKIEVYDDLQLNNLLYSQNYTRLKRKRKKNVTPQTEEEAVEVNAEDGDAADVEGDIAPTAESESEASAQ